MSRFKLNNTVKLEINAHIQKTFKSLQCVWVTQLVKYLPLPQLMIPGSWDRALHRAPCLARSLLPPLALPLLVFPLSLSLSLCQINK